MKAKGIVVVCLAGLFAGASPAEADPCGMVPPITTIERQPITRVGAQKTFVAYHDGIETMVLRPGFEGKVDQFGMLIPFPTPPAIRKVDDNMFTHIAAAIDPPAVYAYVQQQWGRRGRGGGMMKSSSAPSAESRADRAGLAYDEVRVVRQEAVGMYEVAVLAAGSADALKKWMDKHKFRYPDGMDAVTQDYVNIGWFFVAVKTKVGQKKGVNPKPGMREVNPNLPSGATFSGHVQAMGFRFKSKELVVPMRLSAFNPGKKRNIVYILSDSPQRIKSIPKRYVVRQITGTQLFKNVTNPLPLHVVGGTFAQLAPWQKQNLGSQRKAEPHNGLAKELFASDMQAIRRKRLNNPFEEKEKQLLSIGERLNLRGPGLDNLHRDVLKKQKDRSVRAALGDIRQMTMTVIDGEFDRDVIAKENLTFAVYRMTPSRNKRERYDSRQMGPGPARPGKLHADANTPVKRKGSSVRAASAGVLALFLLGLAFIGKQRRRALAKIGTISAVVLALSLLGTGLAHAQSTSIENLIAQLGKPKQAAAAVDALTKIGQPAVDPLLDEIVDNDDLLKTGWAIVILGEIGGDNVDKELTKLHNDANAPPLVRTWAAAARVSMATTPEQVLALGRLGLPGLARAVKVRLKGMFASLKGPKAAEQLLQAASTVPGMAAELGPVIQDLGANVLVGAMLHSTNQQVRRSAAGYLAGLPDKGAVAKAVIKELRFRPGKKTEPWQGGALFVPGIQWEKGDARELTDQLIRWHLWADLHNQSALQQQIHNNLQSMQLVRAAGYQNPNWQQKGTAAWLKIWGDVVGKKAIRSILWQQGAAWTPRYRQVLKTLTLN